LGCIIIPPMLTFYNEPDGIADQIGHITGKILTQFGFMPQSFKSWQGGA
jgi:4-hydroxy-3-polyprenylbenzoate decarboxylase